MDASHHHRHTSLPVLGADLVGAPRGERLHRDADEIGWIVVVDLLEPVVVHLHVDTRWGECGDHSEGEWLHPPTFVVLPVGEPAKRRLDECDLHQPAPSPGTDRRMRHAMGHDATPAATFCAYTAQPAGTSRNHNGGDHPGHHGAAPDAS